MIVGRVRGNHWVGELSDEGVWTCDDLFRQDVLNSLFGPENYSEADGIFGRKLVMNAATRLGGEADFPDLGDVRYPPDPLPGGDVQNYNLDQSAPARRGCHAGLLGEEASAALAALGSPGSVRNYGGLARNAWVTLDSGQHVWIAGDGTIMPHGPGGKGHGMAAGAGEKTDHPTTLKQPVPPPAATPESKIGKTVEPFDPATTKSFEKHLAQAEAGGNQDTYLTDLANEIGFGGHPSVVSKEEMDKLVSAGSEELFRGTPADRAEALKTGPYYAAKGLYSAGYYTAGGPKAKETAAEYAGEGVVTRMVLHKDAKVADYFVLANELIKDSAAHPAPSSEDVEKKQAHIATQIQEALAANDAARVASLTSEHSAVASRSAREKELLYGDAARYAAHRGYDALKVGFMNYTIVLNRSKLVVQQEPA